MKTIGSVKEDLASEKRVSVTPETVKKFIDLNFTVLIEKKYGEHLGISDEEYKNMGASLQGSAKEVLEQSDVILRVNRPSNDEINSIKDRSILIGQFDASSDKRLSCSDFSFFKRTDKLGGVRFVQISFPKLRSRLGTTTCPFGRLEITDKSFEI